MNVEGVDAALDYLKETVRDHLLYGSLAIGPSWHEGRRRGAYRALVLLGFGDAALDAVRQVYEDEGRRWSPQVKASVASMETTLEADE